MLKGEKQEEPHQVAEKSCENQNLENIPPPSIDFEDIDVNAFGKTYKQVQKTPLKKIETNTIQLKSIEKKFLFSSQTRSRESDLSKFDDTPQNNYKKKSIQPTNQDLYLIENEHDDDDDDFLNLDTLVKPITWRNSLTTTNKKNNNDLNIMDIANGMTYSLNLIGTPTVVQQNTPKTPRNRKSIFAQQSGTTDVSKSPLLKLAYISSHGKRVSRSGQI